MSNPDDLSVSVGDDKSDVEETPVEEEASADLNVDVSEDITYLCNR